MSSMVIKPASVTTPLVVPTTNMQLQVDTAGIEDDYEIVENDNECVIVEDEIEDDYCTPTHKHSEFVHTKLKMTSGFIDSLSTEHRDHIKKFGHTLRALCLSGCSFTEVKPIERLLDHFSKLKKLELNNCHLSDESYEVIAQFTDLEELNVSDNNDNKTHLGIRKIVKLQKLNTLNLSKHRYLLDDDLIFIVKGLPKLTTLIISQCTLLTSKIIEDPSLQRLKSLDISNSSLDTDTLSQKWSQLKQIHIISNMHKELFNNNLHSS